jgi:hypothetical protein
MKYFRFLALIAAIGLTSFSYPDRRTVERCGYLTRVYAEAAKMSVLIYDGEEIMDGGTYYNPSTARYCFTVTIKCNW